MIEWKKENVGMLTEKKNQLLVEILRIEGKEDSGIEGKEDW